MTLAKCAVVQLKGVHQYYPHNVKG